MKILIFPLLMTALTGLSSALLLQCTNMVQLYESSPNYSGAGGSWGTIAKDGKATTTLCVVDLPLKAAGKTCRLKFTSPYYVYTGGSTSGQVFTLGSPNISGATWNARGPAYRDQHIGSFSNANIYGDATWTTNTFNCPTGLKGFEVVPVGDLEYIYWTLPNGLQVEVVGL